MVPYLKLKEGQSLEVTEKFLDSIQGDYRFDVTVSSALSEMPEIGRNIAFYTLPILVPMERYYEIIQNFGEDRAVYNYRTYMNLLVEDGLDAEVQAQAEQICGTYLGTSDFYTSSKTQRALDRAADRCDHADRLQFDCTIWYHWNLIGSSGDSE